MKRLFRLLPAALLSVAALAWTPSARASGLEVYHLYVIWLSGEGESDQANLDGFIACLYDRSNYFDYWGGDVLVVEEGSYVVPAPSYLGDASDIGPFIEGLITSGAVPAAPSWGTPVYEVLVDPSQTSCSLGGGTGGRNAVGTVDGQPAGLVINTTNPSAFWPYRTALACETTLTEHEVTEAIDGLRGGDQCAGDFCCEGWCGSAPSCSNLTGLVCPGAPATTFTGSSACGDVNGYLVQTLSHQGATTCYGYVTCDFSIGDECSSDEETLHAPCTADTDCCSGTICANWSYTGTDPTQVCCKGVGASCTQGTDCCGGVGCTGGVCVCVAEGAFCENDGDCCAGLVCSSGACAAAPPPAPEPQPEAGAEGGHDAGHRGGGRGPDASADDAGRHRGGHGAAGGGFGSSTSQGCGCRVAGARGGGAPFGAAGGLALALALALRKRRSLHSRVPPAAGASPGVEGRRAAAPTNLE